MGRAKHISLLGSLHVSPLADSSPDAPWFWIIGGPNGAGKTTVASQFLKEFMPSAEFINADEFAKQLRPVI